ncbi:YwbE family protein [Natronobiforma cellulositropha]|uniref:YwbE family protein n=1 Tax=Natronobiforma cellulositropha TaxID=1679076 RepID=UPI0021D5762A|nr:YwbE family protein [Natronobiforma cellulositropha]
MAGERPSADDLTQGVTVRIVQEEQSVASSDDQAVLGEVREIIGDEPEGAKVDLKSGVVGHVQSIVTGE